MKMKIELKMQIHREQKMQIEKTIKVKKTWKRTNTIFRKLTTTEFCQPLARNNTFKKSAATWGTLIQLKTNLSKSGRDRKAEWGRTISTNIEECIRGARRGSIMVEKWIDEIARMERPRKQNEDGVKSMKVGDGIRNIGRGCGISMTDCGISKRMGKARGRLTSGAEHWLMGREDQGTLSAGGDTRKEGSPPTT
jgi:hypothetical protein